MADQKITALTAGTAVLTTDILAYVEDPGGTPVTKKITIANLKASIFNTPTLVTPVLGVASMTSINKWAMTAPTTAATLVAGGDSQTYTFPATSATLFGSTTKADALDAGRFAADAGANDTYVATLSPAITAYVTGVHYRFMANTANTGAATVNFNALGAKTIVKVAGGITTALADNDIRAGQWVDLVYDGTNMQMQSTLGNAAAGTFTNPGAGSSSEKFGASSSAAGNFTVAFGNGAAAGSDQSTAIGWNTTVNGACTGAIVVGGGSSISASCGGAIVIGNAAGAGTGNTTGASSISIGIGSIAFTANTMVVGSGTQAINVFYGGKGEKHATPVVFTLSGTHGLGSNIAGADLALQPGAGTGTGVAGAVIFYTAPAGASSSTRNTFVECARFTTTGVLAFPTTITAGGTTGNQTINKQSGTVNIAAAGTTVTVTNSLVTTSSIVMAVIRTADATARLTNVVPGTGSFVINIVAATAEVSIGFVVLNQ